MTDHVEQLRPLLGKTMVIVAHPDDEALGCASLLQQMEQAIVVFCTDGAPRDNYFWREYCVREEYAGVRRREALAALDHAGVAFVEFLPIADQELHLNLRTAFDQLSDAIERYRPDALLTLAYEGGHPDHDSCSFLGAELGQRFELPVFEMPLYHRAGGEITFQAFIAPTTGEMEQVSDGQMLENKRRVIQEYVSQKLTTEDFELSREIFRKQAKYDYSRPAHPGKLNYEAWGWKVKGAEVCANLIAFNEAIAKKPQRARRAATAAGRSGTRSKRAA